MSDYKIQSISYSVASNLYEKNSKLLDKVIQSASQVQDKVSIGEENRVLEGKMTHQDRLKEAQYDLLTDGDKIKQVSNSGFFNLIKEKFNQIKNSENLSTRNITEEVNTVELANSLNEAQIAIEQIVAVRDKIVSGYKDILNSAF
jgi:flagellar hook-basal body complex protein FliE